MITTRSAGIQDLEGLTRLFDDYRIFYEKKSYQAGARKFLAERIKNGDSEIFVAESENKRLVGFVQLYPLFSSTRMKRLWLLNDLFVDADSRGMGVSVMLIDRAKELCKETGACGLSLETAKTNEIGNSLYPKTGFTLDTEHNYYFWTNS